MNVTDFLKTTPGMLTLAAMFLAAGIFGAVNWHCSLTPDVPMVAVNATPETLQMTRDRYDAEVEFRRQNVMVPLAISVPLTFVGIIAAFVCVVSCVPEGI